MKKKTLTSLIIMLILISIPNIMFAFASEIVDPKPEVPTEISDVSANILGAIQWAAYAIAIGMLLYIGIKYVLASANERADLKKVSLNYVIGAFVIVAAVPIFSAVVELFTGDKMEVAENKEQTIVRDCSKLGHYWVESNEYDDATDSYELVYICKACNEKMVGESTPEDIDEIVAESGLKTDAHAYLEPLGGAGCTGRMKSFLKEENDKAYIYDLICDTCEKKLSQPYIKWKTYVDNGENMSVVSSTIENNQDVENLSQSESGDTSKTSEPETSPTTQTSQNSNSNFEENNKYADVELWNATQNDSRGEQANKKVNITYMCSKTAGWYENNLGVDPRCYAYGTIDKDGYLCKFVGFDVVSETESKFYSVDNELKDQTPPYYYFVCEDGDSGSEFFVRARYERIY